MLKRQRIYYYFSKFASEALHIVIFENFVKINDLLLIEIESYLYFASLSKSLTTQVTIIQTFLHCRPEAISYKGRKTFSKSKSSIFANWFKLERECFLQKHCHLHLKFRDKKCIDWTTKTNCTFCFTTIKVPRWNSEISN